MPDLNEIALFVRVAQLGSFSAAARSLGAPVSTVSRKVAELERRLGTTLIRRTTRKLNLSEQGRAFYERCAPLLDGLETAEAALGAASHGTQGILRVTAPAALGRGEFVDFVSGFLRQHPGVSVDLTITNQFVDLVGTQIDLAIRFGKLADSGVVARRLGDSQRVLVASSAYLARRGKPRSLADLSSHDCVLFLGETSRNEWRLQVGKRRASVRVGGPASANNLETVNELALRGHGIALLPEPYARAGVASGSLERVLPRWASPPIPVHAVYLSRKFVPAKLTAFLEALMVWENFTWRRVRLAGAR